MKYGFYEFDWKSDSLNWCLKIKKSANKRSETLDYIYFFTFEALGHYCIKNGIAILNNRGLNFKGV